MQDRPSARRASRRTALALAGLALAFFCAVIVNHLPA
jgi:hypothetical protein